MSEAVVRLEKALECGPAEVGLLASGLARIAAAGIPVPEGLCITSAVYREATKPLGLAGREEELRKLKHGRDELTSALAAIRSELTERIAGTGQVQSLAQRAGELSSALVTVELSPVAPTFEAAAIAGLRWRAAFLPPEAAPDAAAQCWSAIWTQRAFLVRKRIGAPAQQTACAVLVTEGRPDPLEGTIKRALNPEEEDAAWVILADETRRAGLDQLKPGGMMAEERLSSPLTAAQAEAIQILAEAAEEELGQHLGLRWSFDGRRFMITGISPS